MTHRVTLRFSVPEPTKLKNRSVFRVQVTAFGAQNVDEEIFLHQNTTDDPPQDEFIAICSAYDLSVYPVNAPDDNTEFPFFRKSTADFLLPSVTDVQEVVATIQEQVTTLMKTLDTLEDLSTQLLVQIPTTTTTTPAP